MRKRSALNKACVRRWKRVRVCSPRPRLIIITPNCLRVDNAIIFLRSVSAVAAIPAMSIVSLAIIRMAGENHQVFDRNG